MNDELILANGLDQPYPLNMDELNEEVSNAVNAIYMATTKEQALGICAYFKRQTQVAGLSLAYALTMLESRWEELGGENNFHEDVSTYLGIHSHTVERYVRVCKMLENVPNDVRHHLSQKSMTQLMPIGNAVAQGHFINDQQWQQIINAPDANTIGALMHEIKGTEPRKNRLSLWMDEVGTVWVYVQNEKYFVGSLEITDETDAVKKAIKRIVDNAGILSK